MAFIMRHGLGPFRQTVVGQPVTNEQTVTNEQQTQEKPAKKLPPVKPDFNSDEFKGFGTEQVPVVSGLASGKTIREMGRLIKNLDVKVQGDLTTTPAYKYSQGSMLGALIGRVTGNEDSDYYKVNDKGSASMKNATTINTIDPTKPDPMTKEEARQLAKDVKEGMRSGQNVKIDGTNVTTGGEVMEERKYDKKKRGEANYNKEVIAYTKQQNLEKREAEMAAKRAAYDAAKVAQAQTRQENQAKEEARKAKIYAERDAKKAEWAAAGAKSAAEAEAKKAKLQAERDAKKNGGKKPVEETQPATNEPVAQQNRTPFYQRGMMSDKMALQNKNKIMSKSPPFEQGKNSNTGEFLISDNTIQRDSIGSDGKFKGKITENKKTFKTPGKTTTVVAPEEEKKKETKAVVVVKKKVPAKKVKAKVVTKPKAVVKPKPVVEPKPVVSSNTTAPTSEVTPANPTTSEITTPDTEREESTSSFEPAVEETPKPKPNPQKISLFAGSKKETSMSGGTGGGSTDNSTEGGCGCKK